MENPVSSGSCTGGAPAASEESLSVCCWRYSHHTFRICACLQMSSNSTCPSYLCVSGRMGGQGTGKGGLGLLLLSSAFAAAQVVLLQLSLEGPSGESVAILRMLWMLYG